MLTGAHYTTHKRTARTVSVPPDEYTVSTLATAMSRALNDGTQFSGSGAPSGSEYIVSTEGSKIMVRLGQEVINGLDRFVILP